MSSSCLPLSFTSALFPKFQVSTPDRSFCPFLISKSPKHSISRTFICFSLSSSNNSNYEREEARWLREEQRWLREEQRWLREESRWHAERESLLREISALNLRMQELERRPSEIQGVSVAEAVAKVAALLQAVNRIAESGSSAVPMVLEGATTVEGGKVEEEEVVVVKNVIGDGLQVGNEVNFKKRTTLRKGSEGEDVRAMQEALHNLGFYSGEEDMEFSSFSSGTERAVKTWQATFGAPEDGIMTAELQERLYMEQHIGTSGLSVNVQRKGNYEDGNGAAVASITEIPEIQKTVVEDDGVTGVEVSRHRVFLLGENRWEDPSRLGGSNKQVNGAKNKISTLNCLTCRGEGRLLCSECDGTGEPNIEEQFMDWVGDGAKCPYCEGLGYAICDVCGGKSVV